MESELFPMTKVKYRVLALNGYGDHEQGDEVEIDLTADQEKQALELGFLEPVHKTKKKEEETDA